MGDQQGGDRSGPWYRECFRVRTAKEMAAEFIGTYVYVTFGLAAWASFTLSQALVGLWQVGVIWGFGAAIGMLIAWHTSGGHLNPAITIALCIFRRKENPWWRIVTYLPSQFLAAVLAGCTIFACYYDAFKVFEESRGINRNGGIGSELSAMVFCDYFPNPGIYGASTANNNLDRIVRPGGAFGIELMNTALFAIIYFAFSDKKNRFLNRSVTGNWMSPVIIGIALGLLIAAWGPLTMVSMNPSRDFGPRLVALLAGWFKTAIPAPRKGFWVYITGPFVGALVGAAIYQFIMHLALPSQKDLQEKYGDEYELEDGTNMGTFVLKKKGGSDEVYLMRQRN